MKTKITAALIALMLAPNLTMAMGCSGAKNDVTASSCIEGSVYDATAGKCVVSPTT
jgi:hypothetical protein